MKQEHINEIKAIVILAIGMIFFASLVSFTPDDLPWYTSHPNVPAKNLIRITGAYMAGTLLFIFGYSAYIFVVSLLIVSWNMAFSKRKDMPLSASKVVSFFVLFCVLSSLFSLVGNGESVIRFQKGGVIGLLVSDFLFKYFGMIGSLIILFMMGAMALVTTSGILLAPIFLRISEYFSQLMDKAKERAQKPKAAAPALTPKINLGQQLREKMSVKPKEETKSNPATVKPQQKAKEDNIRDEKETNIPAEESKNKPAEPKIKIAHQEKANYEANEPDIIDEYTLPHLDLLDNPPEIATAKLQNDLIHGAKLLEDTLANFGVRAKVVDIERGPAITRYELEPAAGVKVQKFTILSDDIALAMRAATVRIVAPIPGKNRVGIEVPNSDSGSVFLKDVLSTREFKESKSKVTLCLGKDIAGKPMVADLAEMPHLLIAGTTGSGKTVCVNSIIMSILFNASPEEVKFVLVDPKMVELAQYNDIPHLLAPTVTDAKKASGVLLWVVGEMEERYRKLSKVGARNILSYNALGHRMPYIVIIIDELADLMQVSAKGVESSIARLAQLSRAVGIHLILATQRPSVNVITGVIKANFPARISFKVASKVDSRTVLDMNGAESLLGKGDMLFMKPGDAKPTRGQGNFVKDQEIARVIRYIKDQQAPKYNENILQQQTSGAMMGANEKDEYYDEALRLVIETNQASVSILQRRMRLGYTRAARLIDMMEQNGVVGPYCGSKPREILVDREQWLLEHAQEKTKEE